MKRFCVVLTFMGIFLWTFGQQNDSVEMVKYNPDFEFNDGFYANFNMVKSNSPIPAARIVSDVDLIDRDYYDKVVSRDEIIFYDNNGVKQTFKSKNIWGYARNGVLYINVGEAFHRISFVGSICHFVASVTTYNANYYDPYGYNPYNYNSYYNNRNMAPQSRYANTELRQYLMDFSSGEVMEYDMDGVEILLMKDPELYDDYVSLSRRKKGQLKFVYIRRFNEKHPLYLPAD
jgi:hypothetical protein